MGGKLAVRVVSGLHSGDHEVRRLGLEIPGD